MNGFETNEISEKSNGGTELTVRSVQSSLPPELLEHFQIIPSRPRELKEDKIRILNFHDLPLDPEVAEIRNETYRDSFHKFVFNSNWQLNEFHSKLGVPLDSKVAVIENPITPFEYKQKDFSGKIRLVYFSTPQRGLEILVPVFEKLCEKYDNIHLDVFSSFKIYGWDEMDKNYESLYERIHQHPFMTYYGFVEQNTLREEISKAHILAYPSIWQETSCRVLIESMSAGLLCVHPNFAALPDTSGSLNLMYQYNENPNQHANVFYAYLDHAIDSVKTENTQNFLGFIKKYTDNRYNIDKISNIWKNELEQLLARYPNEETRKKVSSQVFKYRT